jgi:hypothetical protein
LHDGENQSEHADPQLVQTARLLDRMSIEVVRIRNTGSFDIAPDDFEVPISFTFGKRIVWDARISDASSPDLRELVREGMEFFSTEPASPGQPTEREKLSGVRAWFPSRVKEFSVPRNAPPRNPPHPSGTVCAWPNFPAPQVH